MGRVGYSPMHLTRAVVSGPEAFPVMGIHAECLASDPALWKRN